MFELLFIALAIATISLAITKSMIFNSLRDYADENFPEMFSGLLKCHFCMNHWIALLFLFFVQQYFMVFSYYIFIQYVINYFSLVGLASVFSSILNYYLLQPDAQVEFYKAKLETSKNLIRKLSAKE